MMLLICTVIGILISVGLIYLMPYFESKDPVTKPISQPKAISIDFDLLQKKINSIVEKGETIENAKAQVKKWEEERIRRSLWLIHYPIVVNDFKSTYEIEDYFDGTLKDYLEEKKEVIHDRVNLNIKYSLNKFKGELEKL